MNIVINGKCTKSCSFCFEDDHFKSSTPDMTIEEFKKLLDFTISSYDKNNIPISLLGGEPSIHPKFLEMLDILIEREAELEEEKNIDLIVITNGDLLGTYIDKLYKFKYSPDILLNVSSMILNKKEVVNKIDKLIQYNRRGNINFGISFTVTNFSIIEELKFLCEKYSPEDLYHFRVAFASDTKVTDFNYYVENKKYILEAYDFLDKNNRQIGMDCSKIPTCAFTEEEFTRLQKYNFLNPENYQDHLLAHCGLNTDVLPNGDIIHCMPLKDYEEEKKKYYDFDNLNDLHKYTYLMKIDAAKEKIKNASICKDCPLYAKGKCFAGCVGMKATPTDEKIREKFVWISKL